MLTRSTLVVIAASVAFGATLLLRAEQAPPGALTIVVESSAATPGTPDLLSQATIAAGGRLFAASECADCHGPSGEGDPDFAPALNKVAFIHGHGDQEIFTTIRQGVPETDMKAHPKLSDEEIWQLVAYVKSLAPVKERTFTELHCIGCHGEWAKSGGLVLEGLTLSNVPGDAAVWEKVVRKLGAGEMPPASVHVRPSSADTARFVTHLESALDRAAAARPNPGVSMAHRLNRAEYSNAIRDLLAVDVEAGRWLPVDDSGYGFDNIAAVLSTSPALLERYMSAARQVSRLAIGDTSVKPGEHIYDAPFDPVKGLRNEQLNPDLPFGSRGGMSVRHYFPVDGEYTIALRFVADLLSPVNGIAEVSTEDKYVVRQSVRAGLHTIGAATPREDLKAEAEAPAGPRGLAAASLVGRINQASMDLFLDRERLQHFELDPRAPSTLAKLVVRGPFNVLGRGDTPSRAKVFVCRPTSAVDEGACARRILGNLARRAFRRPVTNVDIDPLYAFYEAGRKGGDFDSGIERALEAVLVSPDFLFRIERNQAAGTTGQVQRVTDVDLASRLSFFVWSSIPDDRLLGLAEQGRLRDSAVLRAEVDRMLADPKSDALVDNFAGQWLQIRSVELARPDPTIFDFDEFLRRAFMEETTLFVTSIVRENRSIMDLLDADYTYLNQRLAEHYGVPNVYGSQFRRVKHTDPNRRGLLGQGSILTVTSYPNRTSVVQRGKWVLENLLGSPPPPPPPNVPTLEAASSGKKLTMREQMQAHRANPVCASCHGRMDPLGFALENYDGVGRWRETDGGLPIDPSGTLPDGTPFIGPAGLRQLFLTRFKDAFVHNATEKLMTYALGRGVEYYDQPAVRTVLRDAAQDNYRMSSLVLGIVKSVPFQMRRVGEP
jgi:mono/diheme cytochrome c family protein